MLLLEPAIELVKATVEFFNVVSSRAARDAIFDEVKQLRRVEDAAAGVGGAVPDGTAAATPGVDAAVGASQVPSLPPQRAGRRPRVVTGTGGL